MNEAFDLFSDLRNGRSAHFVKRYLVASVCCVTRISGSLGILGQSGRVPLLNSEIGNLIPPSLACR